MTEKTQSLSDFIKSNVFIAGAGALATLIGLIVSIQNAQPIVMRWLGWPDCFSYAKSYKGLWSEFKQENRSWGEYWPDQAHPGFQFREESRTREFIFILNITKREGEPNWRNLRVRIPVCGGQAKIAFSIPPVWVDLVEVIRR